MSSHNVALLTTDNTFHTQNLMLLYWVTIHCIWRILSIIFYSIQPSSYKHLVAFALSDGMGSISTMGNYEHLYLLDITSTYKHPNADELFKTVVTYALFSPHG
jgi:hypothetical protein